MDRDAAILTGELTEDEVVTETVWDCSGADEPVGRSTWFVNTEMPKALQGAIKIR